MFVVLVAAPALGPRRLATQHLAAAAAAPEEAPASTRTRVYLLVGGSNQDGRGNAAELTTDNLERLGRVQSRVQLVYSGGLDHRLSSPRYSEEEVRMRSEGPLNYTATPLLCPMLSPNPGLAGCRLSCCSLRPRAA